MKAMNWVLEQITVTGSAKAVLFMLAYRYNDQRGDCFPGIQRIANDAGLSRDTIMRALTKLVEADLVTIEKRGGDGSGRLTNIYHLPAFDQIDAKLQIATLHQGGKVASCGGLSRNLPGAKSQPATQTESKGKKNRKGGHASRRAPKNFQIDDDMKTWLRQENITPEFAKRELQKLLNYEFRTPRKDWQATFRNWMLRAKEWQPSTTTTQPPVQTQTEELATHLNIKRREGESDEAFRVRVCNESVMADYPIHGGRRH